MDVQNTKREFKVVKGKSVVVPTLEDVAQQVSGLNGRVRKVTDTAPIRRALAEQFKTQMACPVTVRRHLKTLGLL